MDSSTVDPGLKGFFTAVGDSAETDAPTPEQEHVDTAQDRAVAADTDAPETPESDLSAEDVVAARLAASLEESGIEIPDPTDVEAETTPAAGDPLLLTPAEGELSLDSMTPEQLRELAEEAIRLRGEVSTTSQQEATRKVQAAEAAAISQVQAEYEQVLANSARHYQNYYQQELAKLVPQVTEEQLPAAAAALASRVWAARQEFETGQLEGTKDFVGYEALAEQARISARLASPDFRQYAAEHLLRQAGLSMELAPEVLKVRDTRDFEAEVTKLVATRDMLLAERKKNQAQLRLEGNKRLQETTPRTAATGRPRGGKPPAYKGTAAEGVAIVATMRR